MSACLRPTTFSSSAALRSSRRPVAACPARSASRRTAVLVRAAFQPPEGPLASALDRFLRRYDVVSTGLGALAVTSFCVSRGQDPWTALSITFTSTVVALVLNEVISNNESSSSS